MARDATLETAMREEIIELIMLGYYRFRNLLGKVEGLNEGESFLLFDG